MWRDGFLLLITFSCVNSIYLLLYISDLFYIFPIYEYLSILCTVVTSEINLNLKKHENDI